MGYIFNNKVEVKKHKKQMTSEECENVRKKLMRLDNYKVYKSINSNKHLQVRLEGKEIHFTTGCIYGWLKRGEIIEYKIQQRLNENTKATERVVVRGDYNEAQDIVVVIDLTRCIIVTAWKNEKTDFHKTLDLALYNKFLKIN